MRISNAERQALQEGQEILRQGCQSRQGSGWGSPRRHLSAQGSRSGVYEGGISKGLPVVSHTTNAMDVLHEEENGNGRPETRESAVQLWKKSSAKPQSGQMRDRRGRASKRSESKDNQR